MASRKMCSRFIMQRLNYTNTSTQTTGTHNPFPKCTKKGFCDVKNAHIEKIKCVDGWRDIILETNNPNLTSHAPLIIRVS